MKKVFTATIIKRDGKLEHILDSKRELYKEFVSSIDEGSKVDIFLDVSGAQGSKAQLAKIHAMIRQLANDTGDDFDTLKIFIKDKAGLRMGPDIKSFADCDSDQLNSIIQVILKYGDFAGSNLR